MTKKQKFKPRLNKSNLTTIVSISFLIFSLFLSSIFSPVCCEDDTSEKDIIEATLSPSMPKQGDVVVIKIKKDPEKKGLPKIFFQKTKLPVFELSNEYYRSLIPLTANFKLGKHQVEIFYKGKVKRIDLVVHETKYPLQELTLTKEVAGLKASNTERNLVNKALSIHSEKKLWTGKFIFPSTARQSTPYGVKRRVNGVINPDYFHKGLDFAGKEGSDILATEDGIIVLAGQTSKGFVVNGNCLFIDHGHGVISGYLHLSKILVKEGDFVKKGQLIGKVGSTGIASGPHLHWGIYISGKTVDPLCWTSMIIE